MQKLILWDIDGTLIRTNRAGLVALARAFAASHGHQPDMAAVEVAGRTDRWIIGRMLATHGIEPSAERIQAVLEDYLGHLQGELRAATGRLLPGVLELLETFHQRPDVAQGLLTGNVERGARIKLEHFRVWHYFAFGAYGDDSPFRDDLGPHALRRARAHHATDFAPERVVVVGDTPHDISCGRAIGARTVAVATGGFSREELAAHGPTAVFADFSDPAALVRLVDTL